jgi:nitronate monooxygenase
MKLMIAYCTVRRLPKEINMSAANFLDCELPIIQAPMAGVQDSALALAVCSAGGLGSLPCAMLGQEQLHEQLSILSTQTDQPYNANFFCHQSPEHNAQSQQRWCQQLQPYFSELGVSEDELVVGSGLKPFNHDIADVVEAFKPPVVSFHFGLPAQDLLQRVKSWGSLVLSSATNVAEAQWLEANGVDGIIAQGLEAGGHRGIFLSSDLSNQIGTFSLLPQIVSAVNVPVIAAGGIADAKGVAAALSLGAAAVQLGTSFLLCPETNTSELNRHALKSEASRQTSVTNVFTGRPARSIVNRIIREIGPISAHTPDFPLASKAIALLRKQAEQQGCTDFTSLWCGQNASGCREVRAADLVRSLITER